MSGTSCYTCHAPFPHPDLWDTTFVGFRTSDHFHGTYLRVNDWKLTQCQACHGHAYDGGRVDFSCTQSGCHVDKNGAAKPPESCNTCHGNFHGVATDTTSWAPPRAVNGDTLETAPGVGAHQAHLVDGDFSNVIRCAECHTVPSSYTDAGHIDASGQAHVLFNGALAGMTTGNGTFTTHPSFDPGTLKCSNVYCHGSWKADSASAPEGNQFVYTASSISGNSFSPMWTGGESQAACGTTCHSLPPAGHGDMGGSVDDPSPCYGCHYGSDTMDKTKHIKGKITYGGEDRPF
jgi:predicted CxxxxCH...CXXCH cytochrome family protein